MTNTAERAEFWKEFILTKCDFPAPEKLRSQFAHAELSKFCECGCNSFKVSVHADATVPVLATPGPYSAVFEANFHLAEEGKTLEIILFTGEDGNLAYVEIDCCANSYPIPETVIAQEPPYHVYTSRALAL